MGQTNSRSGSPPEPRPPQPQSSPSSSANPFQLNQPDLPSSSTPPSTKNSPHASFRRSVRRLLPHTRHTLDESTSSHSTSSFRKRWRSSRRFSKPPSSPSNPPNPSNEPCSSLSPSPVLIDSPPVPDSLPIRAEILTGTPLQRPLSPASCALVAQSCPPSPLARPDPDTLSLDLSRLDHDHPDQTDIPQIVVGVPESHVGGALHYGPEDFDQSEQIDREINDFLSDHPHDKAFVEGSSHDGRDPSPPTELVRDSTSFELSPEPASDSQLQPPRHFQPPGPLVVVQGVVNTSDNPTAAQSSMSRPSRTPSNTHPSAGPPASHRRASSTRRPAGQSEERHSARSRLSALIPRPGSMLDSRPSTSDRSSFPSHESRPSSEISSSLPDSSTSDRLITTDDEFAPDSDNRLSIDGDVRPRPLSPGSIDVLGTLLSVAAAATAASLFSPSLAFQANADSYAPPPSGIPRPMSPTPTAGLGGSDGLAGLPGFGLDRSDSLPPFAPIASAQQTREGREGRERIRNVWESFRERLGLNRASPSQPSGDAPQSSQEQNNMRPGEIMLAEMARALNIGLGLNSDGSSNAEQSPEPSTNPESDPVLQSPDTTSSTRPLPLEDSFERFLLNLQADLRAALSDDGANAVPTSIASDSLESLENDDDAASGHLPVFDELPVGLAGDNEDDSPPPLEDGSDSEDEDEGGGLNYEDHTSTRTPTPMPSATSHAPSRVDHSSPRSTPRDDNGNVDRGSPGINLWRLYRFQPIPASPIASHVANTTSPGVPLSPTSSTTLPDPDSLHQHRPPTVSSPPSPSGSASSPLPVAPPSDSADPSPAASTPTVDATSNMVVPVIVVGLQSVDMGQAHGHGFAHPDSDLTPSDSHDSDRRSVSFDEGHGAATPMDNTEAATPRGRSWQSRAATALRNLRPGRRNGSRGRRATEGTGSRTFLIYVIGGYYPPNHHMVTGSDNLDSYEALWELAELLGQVKPPVATREDIDKSGLQIFNSSELEQYEQQGKVASNCVERCLICLDDYGAEDELRLMSCKHAFHKDCVDKWLQVGRNNCPACRTKGVSTPGDAPH